jgi:hypothetical protein
MVQTDREPSSGGYQKSPSRLSRLRLGGNKQNRRARARKWRVRKMESWKDYGTVGTWLDTDVMTACAVVGSITAKPLNVETVRSATDGMPV